MVIAIGGTKQGSGATTLCVHLAVWLLQKKNIKPLIIDAAENPDILNFFHYRSSQWHKFQGADIIERRDTTDEMAVYELIKMKKDLYEHIIIDCGNKIMQYKSILMIADLYLCPIKADPIYIEHADNILDHVLKLNDLWERLQAAADPQKADHLKAFTLLNQEEEGFEDNGILITPNQEGVFVKIPHWYETAGRIPKLNNIHNCMQYNMTVFDTYAAVGQKVFDQIFSTLIR